MLSNDSDPDGNPLTVRAVSNFVGGIPVINGNNTITYTPNPGFSGTGSFTYTNYDGTTESSPATVTVAVTRERRRRAP